MARNRAKLLVAAEALFKERGANVSFDDVAERAGVGVGTVYRHFRSQEELLAAACDERLFAIARVSKTRDGKMNAGAAFRAYLIDLVRCTATYEGLATSLGVVLRNHTPGCEAGSEEGKRLLERAQSEGAIRHEVSLEDVVCVITAIALAVPDPKAKTKIARMVDLFVEGIGAR